jgi:hypothetical protein
MPVYLIHFDRRLSGHAGHYMGSAQQLHERLITHADGHGANIMRYVVAAGITWQLARTWPGYRQEERRLKGRPKGSNHLRTLCPICAPKPRINRWAGGGKIVARKIRVYVTDRTAQYYERAA